MADARVMGGCQSRAPPTWVRYCQIYCQIRGRVGTDGDKNSFCGNNLLIPKVTPPNSNPSLSAKIIFRNQYVIEFHAAIFGSQGYSRFSTVLRVSCSVSQCFTQLWVLLVSEFGKPQIPTRANNLLD